MSLFISRITFGFDVTCSSKDDDQNIICNAACFGSISARLFSRLVMYCRWQVVLRQTTSLPDRDID